MGGHLERGVGRDSLTESEHVILVENLIVDRFTSGGGAGKLGVNIDDLSISQPDTGEQAMEIADTLVRSGAVEVRLGVGRTCRDIA
jgi:hypothetical protein